jgi:chromosome segregation ATPase
MWDPRRSWRRGVRSQNSRFRFTAWGTRGSIRRDEWLEAQLAERDAEITRRGAMCARLQTQLADGETGVAAGRKAAAIMTAELEELQSQLALERNQHSGCRDRSQRAQPRVDELEAQLVARDRLARGAQNEADRNRKELEARLRVADAELATVKAALAVATDNVRTLLQAQDDALPRLEVGSE